MLTSKQTYMCCNLKVPLPPSLPENTHTHTQLIPPLPPRRDGLIILGMDSWHPDLFSEMHEFRREAHTHFVSPLRLFCFPPRARPRREGEQATQQKPVGSAAAILLQSVCTHLSGSEGKRKETVRDPRSVIK